MLYVHLAQKMVMSIFCGNVLAENNCLRQRVGEDVSMLYSSILGQRVGATKH